jgi:hypothetical protein
MVVNQIDRMLEQIDMMTYHIFFRGERGESTLAAAFLINFWNLRLRMR